MRGKRCTSIVRGRILCRGVDGVIKHACIKKTAGISWGFHISHRDLTAASGRKSVMAGEALRDLVCILSGEELGQVLIQLKMMMLGYASTRRAPDGICIEEDEPLLRDIG